MSFKGRLKSNSNTFIDVEFDISAGKGLSIKSGLFDSFIDYSNNFVRVFPLDDDEKGCRISVRDLHGVKALFAFFDSKDVCKDFVKELEKSVEVLDFPSAEGDNAFDVVVTVNTVTYFDCSVEISKSGMKLKFPVRDSVTGFIESTKELVIPLDRWETTFSDVRFSDSSLSFELDGYEYNLSFTEDRFDAFCRAFHKARRQALSPFFKHVKKNNYPDGHQFETLPEKEKEKNLSRKFKRSFSAKYKDEESKNLIDPYRPVTVVFTKFSFTIFSPRYAMIHGITSKSKIYIDKRDFRAVKVHVYGWGNTESDEEHVYKLRLGDQVERDLFIKTFEYIKGKSGDRPEDLSAAFVVKASDSEDGKSSKVTLVLNGNSIKYSGLGEDGVFRAEEFEVWTGLVIKVQEESPYMRIEDPREKVVAKFKFKDRKTMMDFYMACWRYVFKTNGYRLSDLPDLARGIIEKERAEEKRRQKEEKKRKKREAKMKKKQKKEEPKKKEKKKEPSKSSSESSSEGKEDKQSSSSSSSEDESSSSE